MKPSYEELVACICGMALQHCGLSSGKFDTSCLSANEFAEDILQRLGILDENDKLIGRLPLEEAEVRQRLGSKNGNSISRW